MSNKDSLKEQFLMVFSNDGHYQWANDYKKQYIFALKNLNDNEIKNLPEKIIDKSADEIFKVVVEYDKDLKLFSLFKISTSCFNSEYLKIAVISSFLLNEKIFFSSKKFSNLRSSSLFPLNSITIFFESLFLISLILIIFLFLSFLKSYDCFFCFNLYSD